MGQINIAGRRVGDGEPTYFIADIAANHDGSLGRAVRLIHMAAAAGADAAKFQNFRAAQIGSGDITWTEEIEYIAKKGKPTLLATGASDLGDVQRAVAAFLTHNPQLLLMQCNTSYTGSVENFRYVQLNVLKTFAAMYPDLPLGLSDHTPGHAAVLGAVALGARAVEKHFTDDVTREGPDHGFSLDPKAWREMVDRTRELEYALGDGNKTVQPNEQQTVMIQRRCLYAARDVAAGVKLGRQDLTPLRPAYADGIFPYDLDKVLGRATRRALREGDHLRWTDLE
jgi:sialic acid synthase SpsE